MSMNLKDYLAQRKELVETALAQIMFPARGKLSQHIEAMRYSLFAGGKRIRPILCLATCEALGHDPTPFMAAICSLECIHTYSLIHDDLPAMDNDDLRRGKPTNHKVYGEAEAILAGDGLLTFAFDLLASPDLSKTISTQAQVRLISILAQAAGSLGMVGGQALDIASEGKEISLETLRYLHSCKTGALITAAVRMGGVLGQATPAQDENLTSYGHYIGLAFQIVDDLLNVEGTTEQLGKQAGSDAERGKATYPAFFGLERTHALAKEAVENAISTLEPFSSLADPLREMAHYIYYRKN